MLKFLVAISLVLSGCVPRGSATSSALNAGKSHPSLKGESQKASTCVRKEASFLVGANVVDLDDSKDKDLGNDGLRGYGSKKSSQVLDRLVSMGANSLVLPVDIYVEKKGQTLRFISSPLTTSAGQERLRKMIRQAKEKDLQIMVVPHLQLSDGTWRGDLSPSSVVDFLEQYFAAIEPTLLLAEQECVDAFSFAVEFKAMATRPAARPAFAAFIAQLRTRFSGKLSYSANWDEATYVSFWSLLDVIGVNAFFPLAISTADSDEQIRKRVRDILDEMTKLSLREQRPLVWWEVGYKATENALTKPWEWPVDGDKKPVVDVKTQLKAYDFLFSEVKASSFAQLSSRVSGRPTGGAQASSAARGLAGLHVWMMPSDLRDVVHPWRFEPESGFSILNKPSEARFSMFAKAIKAVRARR